MARRPSMVILAALAAALFLPACGDNDAAAPTTAEPTTVATTTSTTTTTTTTSPPTTTSTTTTTLAPTTTSTTTTSTTLPPLPQPIAPPQDSYSTEPVIEVGRIAIPKIGIDRTMYEGIRIPTLDLGPGHWPGSAMPGQRGNVVIAGHRVSNNQDFRNLDQLVQGDEVIFTDLDGTQHRYLVDSVTIEEPSALWIVDQTPASTATLFACHPPGEVTQRIVAHLTLEA